MSLQIQQDLFDLSTEEIEQSKAMYNGKIIKCLIAPFHTYETLEKIVPYTPSTFLFPERDVPIGNLGSFVSIVVNSKHDEIQIITTSMPIITDMIGSCVRILTENDDIVECPIATFSANIHSIKYEIFDNERYRKSKKEKSVQHAVITKLIDDIAKCTSMTDEEYDKFKATVSTIGEDIIRRAIMDKLNRIPRKTNKTLDDAKKLLDKASDPLTSDTERDMLLAEAENIINSFK